MMLLKKAKIQLMLSQPFFATILYNCKLIEDNTIPTAQTDGKDISYNPKFFEKIGIQNTIGVLAHEVMHIAFMHSTRIGNRDHMKWNIACDYAINPIIIDAGLQLPKGGLIDDKYKGMSAEAIYNLLPDDECEGQGKAMGQDGMGIGGVKKSNSRTETETHQLETEIKQLVSSAANIAKKQGKLPGSLEEFVQSILEPTVNWREVLYQFICEVAKNDYTWSMPNSRYLPSGIYLPSLRSEEVGDIIMYIDTSASVSEYELNQFAGELQSILAMFNTGFKILYVDTRISHIQDVEPDDQLILEVKGRGGTDFRPPFEYVEKEGLEPRCAIYFTDGECSSFPETPDYAVLWAVTYKNFKPPFGETVYVNTQNQN